MLILYYAIVLRTKAKLSILSTLPCYLTEGKEASVSNREGRPIVTDYKIRTPFLTFYRSNFTNASMKSF